MATSGKTCYYYLILVIERCSFARYLLKYKWSDFSCLVNMLKSQSESQINRLKNHVYSFSVIIIWLRLFNYVKEMYCLTSTNFYLKVVRYKHLIYFCKMFSGAK